MFYIFALAAALYGGLAVEPSLLPGFVNPGVAAAVAIFCFIMAIRKAIREGGVGK